MCSSGTCGVSTCGVICCAGQGRAVPYPKEVSSARVWPTPQQIPSPREPFWCRRWNEIPTGVPSRSEDLTTNPVFPKKEKRIAPKTVDLGKKHRQIKPSMTQIPSKRKKHVKPSEAQTQPQPRKQAHKTASAQNISSHKHIIVPSVKPEDSK